MIDVVTVPDFSGAAAPTFTARALFFLASWLEFAGGGRRFPLHLACIGSPPDSVSWLAERAGASVSVHEPMGIDPGGMANKLRGLEVTGRTDRVLLVDTDTLVLSDLAPLAEAPAGLLAAPALHPKIAEADWLEIYASLGLEPPRERISSVRGELGLPLSSNAYPTQSRELERMVPYWNAGVIAAPWSCGLRDLWERNIRHVRALHDRRANPKPEFIKSDQGGFALSVEMLRRNGVPFRRLPPEYHAFFQHVYRGAPPLRSVRILHALGFAKRLRTLDQIADVPLFFTRTRLRLLMKLFRGDCVRVRQEPFRRSRQLAAALRETLHLGRILRRLHERHVAPALAMEGRSPARVAVPAWPRSNELEGSRPADAAVS